MSSPNPFAVASNTAPAAPTAAPVAVEADAVNESVEELVADEGKKTRKSSGKPRKPRNRTITEADKKHILAHYSGEATGEIAKSLGLTRAQVYNVVRDTRKRLEGHLEDPNTTPEAKAKIEQALAKLPKKEWSGGAASGPRKSHTLDDILADFGI